MVSGALGSGQDCTVLIANLKYNPVPYPLPSKSLLTVLMLPMKTGQIPFPKPTGLLGASGVDIHVSCTDGQVQ